MVEEETEISCGCRHWESHACFMRGGNPDRPECEIFQVCLCSCHLQEDRHKKTIPPDTGFCRTISDDPDPPIFW